MKIALFGAGGLIGSHLQRVWRSKYEVLCATHTPGDDLFWDLKKGWLDKEDLEEVDLVINLAGESISDGRWTKEKKKRILESRVKSASMIAKAIQGLKKPPKVWIQASATGFYGSRGEEELDESSSGGEGFLATVCRQWEGSAQQVGDATRLVKARFGMVLTPNGGALEKMLPPFRLGLGGKIGSGRQWLSWIALEEIPSIFEHIYYKGISGPVNIVSPDPVRDKEFVETLASVLGKKAYVPLPSVVAKLVFGEMAKELLLASAKVYPKVLIESGYRFHHTPLKQALQGMLK